MNTELINAVVLAENYVKVVDWYMRTFDLEVKLKVEEAFRYTDLARSGKLVVGIAPAEEMDMKPSVPRNNSMILQLSVSDIEKVFGKAKENGGKILFGPSVDKNEGFKYGGLEDIEGNQIWVIENFDFKKDTYVGEGK